MKRTRRGLFVGALIVTAGFAVCTIHPTTGLMLVYIGLVAIELLP